MWNFIKFMVGGFLVLAPIGVCILILGEIASQSSRARAFIILVVAFAVMIVVGTEILLSIKPTPKR